MVGRARNLPEGPNGKDLLHAQCAGHLRFDPSLFSPGSAEYRYLATQSIHTICIDADDPEALMWEHLQPRATTGTSKFTGLDGSVYATAGTVYQYFDLTKRTRPFVCPQRYKDLPRVSHLPRIVPTCNGSSDFRLQRLEPSRAWCRSANIRLIL